MPGPLDALVEELAAVAGRIERECSLRLDVIVADLRRTEAERELRLANLERAVSDRLGTVRDGKDIEPAAVRAMVDEAVAALPAPAPGRDADPAVVAQMVREAVAAIPVPTNGKSVTVDDVRPIIEAAVKEAVAALPAPAPGRDADPSVVAALVADEVAKAVAALPAPENGKDADPGVIARMIDEAVAKLPPPAPGKDGKLPIVKRWVNRVHYEGEVVVCDGSTFQASKDTGHAPPHDDWTCIAAAGLEGRSPRVRETYSPEVKDYRGLDVVALNGAAFIARRDDPGACPGDGWQMISMQGKPGKPGERIKGDPGLMGPPGPKVERMTIDDEGRLTLFNADGSSVDCDLYPLLSKLSG